MLDTAFRLYPSSKAIIPKSNRTSSYRYVTSHLSAEEIMRTAPCANSLIMMTAAIVRRHATPRDPSAHDRKMV